MMDYGAEAIIRHRASRGKVSIASKMKVETMEELSIAYTPGVAAVSMAIHNDKSESFALTNRGNTVAVVSDGSAVLGLGNVGPEAALAVMEGKSILFKGLADIDAFPSAWAPRIMPRLSRPSATWRPPLAALTWKTSPPPVALKSRKACKTWAFRISRRPARHLHRGAGFHHQRPYGSGKRIDEVNIVFSGAGRRRHRFHQIAGGLWSQEHHPGGQSGHHPPGRTDLTPIKTEMLETTNLNNREGGLAEAMQGADVFIGLSVGDAVSQDMVRSMAQDAVVLAAANPTPEIMPDLAAEAGAKVVGTGRSDFPNQINNSLAFPGVFRGALDARATRITTRMKLAAAEALAGLVAEPTPGHIIPWSLDPEVVPAVAHAVAAPGSRAGVGGTGGSMSPEMITIIGVGVALLAAQLSVAGLLITLMIQSENEISNGLTVWKTG